MKRIVLFMAAAAMLFSSCQKEVEETPAGTPGGATFKASFEQSEAKVYLGDDFYYRWEAGDFVSVFTGDYSHRQYKAVSGDVVESDLEYVSTTTSSSESLSDFNYAVFPYYAANTLKDGVIYSTIAADQTYRKNDLNNAIMVSQIPASSTSFVFRNSCALLKINIKIAEDFANLHSVKSITVTSSAHKLSGPATVAAASGDYTAKIDASAETASNSVILTGCETAGLLQADEYLTFYIAIPAGTYEADDLTISILTSTTSAPFNVTAKVPAAYTAARSQYIDLSTTLAKDYNWFEQTNEEIIIKEDVVLVDKAIMNYTENLIKQGFSDQSSIEAIFDVPDHDMVIKGEDLMGEGAVPGADGRPTITFTTTNENAFIINTFTSTTSGLTNDKPKKITLENLRIKGEFRANTVGIYVNDKWNDDISYNQANFISEWKNVDVVEAEILPYTVNEVVQIGAAVCVYGTATFTNCNIHGVKWSSKAQNTEGVNLFDMGCPNSTVITINGGKIGSIYGWEQSQVTFQGGVEVDYAHTINISSNPAWRWTVNDATINTFLVDPHTTYNPNVLINANAKIGTLHFIDTLKATKEGETPDTLFNDSYWASVAVDPNATVEKVIVGETEMTLAEFIAKYSIKATL